MKRILISLLAVFGLSLFAQAQLPSGAAYSKVDPYNKNKTIYYDNLGSTVGKAEVDPYNKNKTNYYDNSNRKTGKAETDPYSKGKTNFSK